MFSHPLPETSLKKLRLNHVRAYAEQHGWNRRGTYRDLLAIFDRGDDSLDQLLVPINPDSGDFTDQMADVIKRLSVFEKRSADIVLNDILSLDADTLRFSVRSAATDHGTLPIEQGLALLDGARRSLLAAACTVIAPDQTYHPRMRRSTAEEFLRTCELGQTEKGSYTVTLKCPMHSPTIASEGGGVSEVPFARRATETLAISIAKVAHAIDEDNVDAALSAQGSGVQLTANLCDALLKMQPDREESSVIFSVSWATAQPPRITMNPVILRSEHFPVIASIAKQLRGEIVPQTAPFIAHVDELRGTIGEHGLRQGEVRLTLFHEDEAIRARTDLNAQQYEMANHAHMAGQPVVIHGILNRGARVSLVSEVRDFELLQQAGHPPSHR